jgi:hypothetical protein
MFFTTENSSDTIPYGGMGHVCMKKMVRRVRTDQRWA